MRVTDKYVLFFGSEFSNWYQCHFEYKGIDFSCSEQAMMWEKAMLFNDTEIASKILESDDPATQKWLGRKVRGFDANVWNEVAVQLVTDICYAKFWQNQELKELMLSFKDKTFVEASPYDKIWGIGLSETDSRCDDEATWQGTNWLGTCLNNVRHKLQSEGN